MGLRGEERGVERLDHALFKAYECSVPGTPQATVVREDDSVEGGRSFFSCLSCVVIVMDVLPFLSVGFINSHTWDLTGPGWESLCGPHGRPGSLMVTRDGH